MMSTSFPRADGVIHLSPLSEEEKRLFFEKMRNTVVVTVRVSTKKRRGRGRGNGAGGAGIVAGGAGDKAATAEDDGRYGTGFVIDSEGHVLTSACNIEGPGSSIVEVKFFGQKKPTPASIVFKNSKKNLIILRPRVLPDGVDYTELAGAEGEDDNVHLGMQVYCIGHPIGLTYNMFVGQVCYPCDSKGSGQCRRIKDIQRIKDLDEELTLVQLNNVHAGGFSANGSPVFDANGRVLGMLLFEFRGFDFAVHYKELRGFIGDFKQKI